MDVVVETKIGKKRVVVIPKAIADAVKVREGQRIRIMAVGDKIVIEPVRDAIWLALHGKKIGKISAEELEEESLLEQQRIAGSR